MAVKNISFIHCVLRITAAKRIQIMYLYSHAGRLTQPTAIRHYYRERERERYYVRNEHEADDDQRQIQ